MNKEVIMRLKEPPENKSKEAVKLREVAVTFAEDIAGPVRDSVDTEGKRRNIALLDAAVHYANKTKGKDVRTYSKGHRQVLRRSG